MVVDVDAVGVGRGDHVLDAELREDERRDRRGGAVGAVDEHAQGGHLDRRAAAAGDPGRVALGRAREAAGLAHARSGRPRALSPISASTRFSSSSPSLKPSPPKSLMPLSGNGLCEAEMTAPRLAPCSRTSQAMPGVGSTPARSARPPADAMPGAQRILEHRARAARVAPDHDDRLVGPALAREQRRGTAERERDLGVEDVAVGDAADSVRAEQPGSHGSASASRTAGGAVRP